MYVVLFQSGHEHVSTTHVVALKIERASFSKTPVTADQSTPYRITKDQNFET